MKKLITSIFILTNLSCNSIDCNKLSFIEFTETEKIIGLNGNPYSGKCKFLYKNGQVNSSRQYLKGKYHGVWTFYYKNGNKKSQINFYCCECCNGQSHTTWWENGNPQWDGYSKYWYENGQLSWRGRYDSDGTLMSSKCWDRNGNEIECK